MKILIIARSFNKYGGISRYAVELAERFVKDHETHLLTTNYDHIIPNLIVHKKPMIRTPFVLQIASNVYYNTKSVRNITANDRDIISHSQGSESLKCDVLTMHSCHKAWVNQYIREKGRKFTINPRDYVVLPIERQAIETGSKKIISISECVKNEILMNYNVPEEKISVIYNGVNLVDFKFDSDKRQKIRENLGINNDEIILMFSGYEFSRKGLKYIIESLPEIRVNTKLLVVGKDNPVPYEQIASKLGVRDKIIFAGFVPDITACYVASDIFVFPTIYEPFGLVITEALSTGLPVVTSKLAGAAEIMTDGYDGLLLNDPTNPSEIAEKINFLIDNETIRKRMGKNGRKTAERYSWDYAAKKTLDVYEEVLKS